MSERIPRRFLQAEWLNVCLLNYCVDPARLEPYLPPGTVLDRWQDEIFVSLVAFDFVNTRVGGLPWPGYRNFTEINLRFYARHKDRRGVVFIREFVPKRLIAWLARELYNEPYVATSMHSKTLTMDDTIQVEHTLHINGSTNRILVTGDRSFVTHPEDSAEHHFKEHQWGFGKNRRGQLGIYEVRHPIWNLYPVKSFEVSWDWAAVYGVEWDFLSQAAPRSVFFAQGSSVEVFWPAFNNS